MLDYPWLVWGIRTIWPTNILKSWKVIIIPTASYRATQLYVALVICVFLQVFCMGMFYNFNLKFFLGMRLMKFFMSKWKKIVKHEIKHIWLYHQQQCYQSLVLPQNKLPFRVRMISNQPLKFFLSKCSGEQWLQWLYLTWNYRAFPKFQDFTLPKCKIYLWFIQAFESQWRHLQRFWPLNG